jgi:hypothetical protein
VRTRTATGAYSAWVSYDWITSPPVLQLEPGGTLQHQLLFSNTSGNPVVNFTALMPIPKSGESLPGMNAISNIQREPFEFTLN